MPLEGHWERQHAPLRPAARRETQLLAAVALALAVAAAIVLFATVGQSARRSSAGCVDVTAASTTGAATLHACGRDAQRWCRSPEAAGDEAVARVLRARCRAAGVLPSSTSTAAR